MSPGEGREGALVVAKRPFPPSSSVLLRGFSLRRRRRRGRLGSSPSPAPVVEVPSSVSVVLPL